MEGMHDLLTPEGIQKSFGVVCTDEKIALMLQHLRLLMQTNATLNLTRICDEEDMLELHLWDSLVALPYLNDAKEVMLLDLGTGGGFPGIPLAIASGRETVLLDSVKKKVAAVQRFVDALNLVNVTTAGCRAEEYAIEHPKNASVVTARAVTRLGALVELSSPLLTKHGRLIALKGQHDLDEERIADKTAKICGMKKICVEETQLPISHQTRTVYVYEKTSEPTIKLPRHNGFAQKKPLVE